MNAFFFVLAADKTGWPLLALGVISLVVGPGWSPSGRVSGRNVKDAGSVLGWSESRSAAVAVVIQCLAAFLLVSAAFYLATS